jgi:hypothetical protein
MKQMCQDIWPNRRYWCPIDNLLDAAAHSGNEALFRYGIGPKMVERSGIAYMNLQLIINTCNIFIGLQLKKAYTRWNDSFCTWNTNQMQHWTEIDREIYYSIMNGKNYMHFKYIKANQMSHLITCTCSKWNPASNKILVYMNCAKLHLFYINYGSLFAINSFLPLWNWPIFIGLPDFK